MIDTLLETLEYAFIGSMSKMTPNQHRKSVKLLIEGNSIVRERNDLF